MARDPPNMKTAATGRRLGQREPAGSEAREVVELHAEEERGSKATATEQPRETEWSGEV